MTDKTSKLSPSCHVAIVGAGVSGLVCARTLKEHDVKVVLFDKAGRPGGRLATRVEQTGDYDHGAQYFTVRDSIFERQVESWRRDGVVAEWPSRLIRIGRDRRSPVSAEARRFVGVPGMNSIAAHLAEKLDIRARSTVRSLVRREGRWFLGTASEEAGPFDRVVVAVPAPQAAALVGAVPALKQQIEKVKMSPCWAVLVSFPSAIETDFDGALIEDDPLSWVARNSSKPGRKGLDSWVLHASNDWTVKNLDTPSNRVGSTLLKCFAQVAGIELPEPIDLQTHLWRFALATDPFSDPCVFDRDAGVAVCGDWCLGPRIEDAYLSGSAAARTILDSFEPPGVSTDS